VSRCAGLYLTLVVVQIFSPLVLPPTIFLFPFFGRGYGSASPIILRRLGWNFSPLLRDEAFVFGESFTTTFESVWFFLHAPPSPPPRSPSHHVPTLFPLPLPSFPGPLPFLFLLRLLSGKTPPSSCPHLLSLSSFFSSMSAAALTSSWIRLLESVSFPQLFSILSRAATSLYTQPATNSCFHIALIIFSSFFHTLVFFSASVIVHAYVWMRFSCFWFVVLPFFSGLSSVTLLLSWFSYSFLLYPPFLLNGFFRTAMNGPNFSSFQDPGNFGYIVVSSVYIFFFFFLRPSAWSFFFLAFSFDLSFLLLIHTLPHYRYIFLFAYFSVRYCVFLPYPRVRFLRFSSRVYLFYLFFLAFCCPLRRVSRSV